MAARRPGNSGVTRATLARDAAKLFRDIRDRFRECESAEKAADAPNNLTRACQEGVLRRAAEAVVQVHKDGLFSTLPDESQKKLDDIVKGYREAGAGLRNDDALLDQIGAFVLRPLHPNRFDVGISPVVWDRTDKSDPDDLASLRRLQNSESLLWNALVCDTLADHIEEELRDVVTPGDGSAGYLPMGELFERLGVRKDRRTRNAAKQALSRARKKAPADDGLFRWDSDKGSKGTALYNVDRARLILDKYR